MRAPVTLTVGVFAQVSVEAVKRDGPGQSDRSAKLKKASKAEKPPL